MDAHLFFWVKGMFKGSKGLELLCLPKMSMGCEFPYSKRFPYRRFPIGDFPIGDFPIGDPPIGDPLYAISL